MKLGISFTLWFTVAAAASAAATQSVSHLAVPHPDQGPVVLEYPSEILVLFPEGVGVAFGRLPGMGPARIQSLQVSERLLLEAMPGTEVPPPTLEWIGPGAVGGVQDWPAYLEARLALGQWPHLGGRVSGETSLEQAAYLGHSIEGAQVVLHTAAPSPLQGQIDWVLKFVELTIGGAAHRGVGWKLRVSGAAEVTHLRMVEPVVTRPRDWTFQQTWGAFLQHQVGKPAPFAVPPGVYGADQQPFYFAGGRHGSVLSFFDQARATQLELFEEGGRHVLQMRIPLGQGGVRETPLKMWLWSDASLPSRWDALDAWTLVFDDVAALYLAQHGLARSELRPTLDMTFPSEAQMQQWIQGGPPALTDSWLYRYAENQLPVLASLGFGALVCVVWETDADHDPSEYLPGSEGFGSGNAPWQLDVSELLGGRPALQHLVNRGHELGVEILLWTSPGHLSNSAPLLVSHPDWVMWTRDGVPETAGYGDVVGMGLETGYFDYALASYADLQASVSFDGFLVDSFLTFGILADERLPQPGPQLDRTLDTMQAWWQTGTSVVHTEGCSPFGVSAGGYGYEEFLYGGPEGERLATEKFLAIEGREYGLYRYRADTLIEPASYYRALASKGHISPLTLDVVLGLPPDDVTQMRQANLDTLAVMDRMQTRHLLGEGSTWFGVLWSQAASPDLVLFAFDNRSFALGGPALVDDITTGTTFPASASFDTQSQHTYVIRFPR